MPEFRQKPEARDPGLTTADLANLDQPTSTMHEMDQEQELDRIDVQQRESLGDDVSIVDRETSARTNETVADSRNETASLLSADESRAFHSRWDAIQASFVDEPRQAVQQADGLVANAIKRLAEIFAEERGHLDQQWDRGGDVSTEDLRIALRRYRSFFGRLLSV
jgi:hypothetical protein